MVRAKTLLLEDRQKVGDDDEERKDGMREVVIRLI